MKKNIEKYIRKNILALSPYSTARDEYQGELGVYLDANENPYDNGFNRYPDPYQKQLKAKLSQIKGVPVDQIFIGNGSDEPIDLVFRVFCEPGRDNVVSIAPTYGMYRVASAINDVECREVQLGEDFTLDVEALLAACDSHTKAIFLCSPNNPTGNSLPTTAIAEIIERFDGMVILDEAYIDFAEQASFLGRLGDYPNLMILQTLSKAWGMAGLRLGLAFADPMLIETFTRVKYPYNINVITQKIVLDQLDNTVQGQIDEIVAQRRFVVGELKKYATIKKIFASDANFVLVKVERPRDVYNLLIENGVIVRDRSKIKGCEGCLRITIGTPAENRTMLDILKNA